MTGEELAQRVREVMFTPVRFREGYDMGEVDDLLDSLRDFDRILVGGQPMPQQLLARSLELGLNVTRTYGRRRALAVWPQFPEAELADLAIDGRLVRLEQRQDALAVVGLDAVHVLRAAL